jgi:hypothetical protein
MHDSHAPQSRPGIPAVAWRVLLVAVVLALGGCDTTGDAASPAQGSLKAHLNGTVVVTIGGAIR